MALNMVLTYIDIYIYLFIILSTWGCIPASVFFTLLLVYFPTGFHSYQVFFPARRLCSPAAAKGLSSATLAHQNGWHPTLSPCQEFQDFRREVSGQDVTLLR